MVSLSEKLDSITDIDISLNVIKTLRTFIKCTRVGGGDQIKNNHGFCIKHMTIYISNGCKERKKFLPAHYIPLPLLTLAGEGGGEQWPPFFWSILFTLYCIIFSYVGYWPVHSQTKIYQFFCYLAKTKKTKFPWITETATFFVFYFNLLCTLFTFRLRNKLTQENLAAP